MLIECFLTNLYSIDVMAPFCLEMKKIGIDCQLALDELFWKVSYGDHFDINKAIKKAKEWGVKLNLRLNYDADIAVTQWTSDWELFGLYKNLKAKIGYGSSIGIKKEVSSILNDFNFDLYFVHGDFQKEVLIERGVESKRIIKIGFPKLKYQKVNFKIDKTKPVITYLPTWDEYKCIDLAIKNLKDLKNFDIYLKPHPLQSKEDIETLSNYFKVLDKDVTIKSILEFSDYIIGDLKSGALFDGLYYTTDKPLIALSKLKFLNLFHKIYTQLDAIITEEDYLGLLNLNVKDKKELQKYLYSIDNNFNLKVSKKSVTFNKGIKDILINRLNKTLKEYYFL